MRTILFLFSLAFLPALAHAQGTDFIPLLPSLPGIQTVSDQISVAGLLSQIYKLCVGLAAVLAILQIMRAGVEYMGGDSITEKKHARELIGTALAGLLLVLSPVIVFSIINPQILNLDIGADKLRDNLAPFDPAPNGYTTVPATSNDECVKKGGSPSGNPPNIVCSVPRTDTSAAASYGTCKDYDPSHIEIVPKNSACKPPGEEVAYIHISDACCKDLPAGYQCCGVSLKDTTAPLPDASTPIHVTKAIYAPITGSSKDYGIVTRADRDAYLKFQTSCMTAHGTIAEKIASKGPVCTTEQRHQTDAPESFAAYLECRDDTVSCKL